MHRCKTDRVADRKRPDVANQHAERRDTGPVHCPTYAEKDAITRSTNLFEKPNPDDSDARDDNDRPPQLIENDESDDEDDGTVGGPTMKVIPVRRGKRRRY